MTLNLFLKAVMIWFVIALFAIANGIFRESFLVPYLGEAAALPASGVTLSLIIFTITYFSFKLIENNSSKTYLLIGIQWVVMTLLFEFVFGHYAVGKSWLELLEVFHLFEGNLFIVALLVSLFSPLIVSKIR